MYLPYVRTALIDTTEWCSEDKALFIWLLTYLHCGWRCHAIHSTHSMLSPGHWQVISSLTFRSLPNNELKISLSQSCSLSHNAVGALGGVGGVPRCAIPVDSWRANQSATREQQKANRTLQFNLMFVFYISKNNQRVVALHEFNLLFDRIRNFTQKPRITVLQSWKWKVKVIAFKTSWSSGRN